MDEPAPSVVRWIDTHAHLNDERFDADLPAVLDRAEAAGVEAILVVGIDVATSRRAVELAARHARLFAVAGIQPNSLGEARPGDFELVEELARAPKVVALGETGLDRYWDAAPIELQREWFDRHLELARSRGLPVVIHCREAEADVVAALAAFHAKTAEPIAGVMHSFTGDGATAKACLQLGLHVSFAGMLTFKKSQELREVAAGVPLDRLLVETDSPYLSPEPFRGKPNEPARVVHTGATLASLHRLPVAELAAATTANARRLFRLPVF